jgi:hypothetical protein
MRTFTLLLFVSRIFLGLFNPSYRSRRIDEDPVEEFQTPPRRPAFSIDAVMEQRLQPPQKSTVGSIEKTASHAHGQIYGMRLPPLPARRIHAAKKKRKEIKIPCSSLKRKKLRYQPRHP